MKRFEYERAMKSSCRMIQAQKFVANFEECSFFLCIDGEWRGYRTKRLAQKARVALIRKAKEQGAFTPSIFLCDKNGETNLNNKESHESHEISKEEPTQVESTQRFIACF